jgi:uncharacterized protein YjdB
MTKRLRLAIPLRAARKQHAFPHLMAALLATSLIAACSSTTDAPLSKLDSSSPVLPDGSADQAPSLPDATPIPPDTTPILRDTNPLPTDTNPLPTDTNPLPTDTNPLPTDTTPPPIDTPPPTVVLSIIVTASNTSVAVGATQQIVAKATYSDSTVTDVTGKVAWTVTPTTAGTISATGLLTGVAVGTAKVQADFGGKSGTIDITVSAVAAKLTGIAVTAAASSVDIGNTVKLTAIGTYSDGTKPDISGKVTWTSSNTALATVSTQGVATAVSVGTVTLTAALDGQTGTAGITVTKSAAVLVSIAVTAPSATVDVGTTLALVANGTYDDSSKKNISSSVTWSSSDATIATVSTAGTVTGIKAGSVTITATSGTKSGSVSLTVTTPMAPSSVAVTASASTVTVGGKVQLTANEVYSDGSKKDVTKTATWTSGTATVATVDANGLVTAVKAGTVIITATSGGKSGTVSLTVNNVVLSTIDVTPAQPSIPAGSTQQFKATGTYSDNTKRDITAEVDWTSSAAAVATISGAAATRGLAAAKAKGTSTITATSGTIKGATVLTVTDAPLVSISVTPAKPVIAKGTTIALIATGTYADNTTKDITADATWTTSAPAVATVGNAVGSDGLVSGLTAGTATITAVLTGQSGAVSLKVTNAVLSSIAITPAGEATIAKGTTKQYAAIGSFNDNTKQDITTLASWTSLDATVATVGDSGGKDGLATAQKAGSTTISAAFAGITSAAVKLNVATSTLVSIAITPATKTIANGTTAQFKATATYTDNSTQDVTVQATWSSSAPGVATISSDTTDGLATASAVGTTTIKAQYSGQSATATLTVTAATLRTIAVTPSPATVVDGLTVALTATGTFSDNSTQDLTTQVSWSCADYSIATISNALGSQGVARGESANTVTIVAALMNKAGTTDLTVTVAQPDHLVIVPPAPKIAIGTMSALVAKMIYTNQSEVVVTDQVTWTSAAPAVATLSTTANQKGWVTGVAAGTSVITIVKDTFSATATLTVTSATLKATNGLTVTPAATSVAGTASTLLTATGTFSDTTTQDLTIQAIWTSSNTAIATVSTGTGSAGKVTGVAAGSANITAAVTIGTTPIQSAISAITVTN